MDKTKLAPYAERLAKAEGKERAAIAAEMSKELGIKISDCWNALKEAGLYPKAAPLPEGGNNLQTDGTDATGANVAQPGANPPPGAGGDGAKTAVILRHKTPHKLYRRAGVVLTQKAQDYLLTAAQIEVLKKDRWVVFAKDGAE